MNIDFGGYKGQGGAYVFEPANQTAEVIFENSISIPTQKFKFFLENSFWILRSGTQLQPSWSSFEAESWAASIAGSQHDSYIACAFTMLSVGGVGSFPTDCACDI